MVASFASMPDELVSHVVKLVCWQDAQLPAIARGALFPDDPDAPDDSDEDRKPEDVLEGYWSPYHGRGIRALVQVNRRFRALALPHLYEVRLIHLSSETLAWLTHAQTYSISAAQASAEFFDFEVVSEWQLGHLVRHVDCRYVADDSDAAQHSLACALRKMPNLATLDLDITILRHVYSSTPSATEVRLARSVKDALGRISSLHFGAVADDLVTKALGNVGAHCLRSLSIRHTSTLVSLGDELSVALDSLAALDEVALGLIKWADRAHFKEHLRFRRVRTLILQTCFNYHEELLLAHHIAPSVHKLTVGFATPSSVTRSALPAPLLPTLRVLTIPSAHTLPDAFDDLRLPGLERLYISLNSPVKEFPFETSFNSSNRRHVLSAALASPSPHSGLWPHLRFSWPSAQSWASASTINATPPYHPTLSSRWSLPRPARPNK